jgi:hypothetical protein
VVTVICPARAFENGHTHACTAAAAGVSGQAIAGSLNVTYNGQVSAPSEEGTYKVIASFTSGDPNYTNATGTGSLIIREHRHDGNRDEDRNRDDHDRDKSTVQH